MVTKAQGWGSLEKTSETPDYGLVKQSVFVALKFF